MRKGIEAQKKALELDPKMSSAYMNMGQSFKEWGKFDLSIENYNTVWFLAFIQLFLTIQIINVHNNHSFDIIHIQQLLQ